MDPKKSLKNLFEESLDRCSPHRSVAEYIKPDKKTGSLRIGDGEQQFDITSRPIYVFAVGKASIPMFEATDQLLGDYLAGSLVVTSDKERTESCQADEVIASAHPVPDERSLKAGQKAKQFLEGLPTESILLTLISGGSSSLLCLPAEEISIDDLNHTFELLNNSGATIREINTVRKHCSQLKGGQMLSFLKTNISIIDLVISDVPDDDLSIIGSGPTTPDSSTFQDAYHVLLEYDLWDHIPKSVHTHIEKGITGEAPETTKPGEDSMGLHRSHIISSARKLANVISDLAKKNYNTYIADGVYNEDVEDVATQIAKQIGKFLTQDSIPLLLIFYGESTVSVTGSGKGGRNQELALRGAIKIAGQKNTTWLSAGTDGIDGPTDAAGAIVDGQTISKAKEKGLDPNKYLKNNDSYHFHEKVGTLFKTGPTGNNLMDLVLVLIK